MMHIYFFVVVLIGILWNIAQATKMSLKATVCRRVCIYKEDSSQQRDVDGMPRENGQII